MLYKKPILIALLLNSMFLGLYFALGIVRYGSLDDYFMSNILTGAYGSSYDVHTYFVNSAYGYFLKPFYMLFPKVGWYFLFELAGIFAVFTTFTYFVIARLGGKFGIPFALILLAAAVPDFYFQVSFTQCATAYTAAGVLLIVVGDLEKNKLYLLGGGLFLLAGSVMRWEGFLLGMPFLCILFTVNAFSRKKIYVSSIIALCIAMTALYGIKKYDESLYSQGDYKYYAEYQPVRSFFGDGAYYDSESTYDELEEREMSGLDYTFARSWIYYDTDVLCADSLRAMAKIAQRNLYTPNWSRMPLAFFTAVSKALTRTNGWCWVILCLILMIIPSKISNLYPWISLSIIAISIGYLLLVNRLVSHVESGIWLYAIASGIPFLYKEGFEQNPFIQKHFKLAQSTMIVIALFFALISVSSQPLKNQWKIIETYEMGNDWKSFIDYAQKHQDDVFLLGFETYKELGNVKDKPYLAIKPGSWQNIFPIGYWNVHLPAMKQELAKRGVENPIKDIVKSNVYLIEDNSSPTFTEYYRRHYHKNLAVDTIATFGKKLLFKYRIAGGDQ